MRDEEEKIRHNQTLFKVIRHFKTASNLAKVLDVKHSAVSQWVKTGHIPALRCYQIEIFTQGKFKAIQLLSVNKEEKCKLENFLLCTTPEKIAIFNKKIQERKNGTIQKN